MKKITLGFLFFMLFAGVYAQATIESIVIEKHNRNAVKLYINQPVKITEEALDAKLKRSGLNGKRKNGIVIYREATLSEISTTKLDIYTRVQQKGIGSIVYMAASKGYDNFTTPEDTVITNNIVVFLNTFVTDANYQSVDVDLTAQQDNIDKLTKAYLKLLNDQKDTEKNKSEAEVNLLKIQHDIDAMKLELDNLKSDLEVLKTKRKEINQQ